jgi:hypothetical protein
MLKKAAVPLLGLLIVVLAGCATTQMAGPPADVNGTWTGSTAGGARTYRVVLKQTGADVTGTLTGAGTDDGPIKGRVEGNSIRLWEADGYRSTPSLIHQRRPDYRVGSRHHADSSANQ